MNCLNTVSKAGKTLKFLEVTQTVVILLTLGVVAFNVVTAFIKKA